MSSLMVQLLFIKALIIANIHWIIEKAREFQKSIYFCFIDYSNQITLPASWEIYMHVKTQQLQLDMEQ